MRYLRVLPRDLFNEANLLKCLARVSLLKPDLLPESVEYFNIAQEPGDGSIFVTNLPIRIRGKNYIPFRPLNSRQPWPLYLDEDTPVFDDQGNFTAEMLALIKGVQCVTSTTLPETNQ